MLKTRDLTKTYDAPGGRLTVLNHVSLEVGPGEFVAVVGPSGAGKSTLLHLLGRLDQPTEGRIWLEGQDITRLSEGRLNQIRNQTIGFVFQFYHLLSEFTALENVLLPAWVWGAQPKAQVRERACQLLEQVGLGARADHRPFELSGGEQQRVAIARALMNSPRILLCDEPTGNLDSENGQRIMGLLRTLNRSQGQTIVMVTHERDIAQVATRILNLRDGHLV